MNESSNDRPDISRRAGLLRLSGIAAGVAVAAGGGFYAWKKFGAADKQPEYVFGNVQRGDIEDLVSGTGSLQPRDYVDVGAQVSGQLKKIHVEVGSEVREGDLLAEINPEQYLAKVDAIRAQLRNQQAQMLEREAQLAQAEISFQRQKNLSKEDATTADALLNAETSLRVSRAQINSLRAQTEQTESSLRVEEANLKYAQIYAPMTGTVVSIAAKQGQTLNANQQAPVILRLADLSTMTVQTQVSEADVSKLWPGMGAYFTTLGSRGRRWFGQLRKIEPTPVVQNNVVLYNALFDVVNPNQTLMTQMTAQVFFVVAMAENALVVPMSAVTLPKGAGRGGEGRGERRRGRDEAASATSPSASSALSGSAASAASTSASPSPSTPPLVAPAGLVSTATAAPVDTRSTRPPSESPAEHASAEAQPAERPRLSEEEREARRQRRMALQAEGGASRPERMPGEGRFSPRDEAEAGERRRRLRDEAGEPQATLPESPAQASRRSTERSSGGERRDDNARRQRPAGNGGNGGGNTPRPQARAPRAAQPVTPRKATVKVAGADGQINEREVMIGVSNRVQAQVLSGLKEGERIVVGIKQAEQERRGPASGGQGGPGMAGTGGLGGGGIGGAGGGMGGGAGGGARGGR